MQTNPSSNENPAATPTHAQVIRIRTRPGTVDLSQAATLKKIEALIANPPVTSHVFTIHPETAKHLLETYNRGNRSKKPVKIRQYVQALKDGEWELTGETIKFSDEARLLDGQNRLYACVEANVPFATHVVFGVVDRAFSKMDQGRIRSGGDVLQIGGYSDTNNLSAACRWLYLIDSGKPKSRESLEPKDTLHLLDTQYPRLPDFLKVAGRIYATHRQPKGLMAALFYLFDKANPIKAAEWASLWENGTENAKSRSITAVNKRIAEIKSFSNGRVHDTARAAMLVIAWNAFVTKKGAITKEELFWDIKDDFPEIKG
ncbi:MAG: hypothetical protein EOP83_28270 [Verrucomicrobiaceae bacterium]|nr:MAG: hypothetical protein EOP83_28270 [Verrucomicrobiaceae bacterium]